MKKLLALLMTICLAFTTFAGVGCKGNEGSNDPNILEIYCYVQGFGSVWLEANIELFKQQDWVKEKYPDLKIELETNSHSSMAGDRLYNQKTSTTDLFFGSYHIDKIDPSYLVNLTETVYLTEVPGKPGTLIWDRLPQLVHEALYEPDYDSTEFEGQEYPDYYGFKYVTMFYGWMYNKTLFDQIGPARGWKLPVTTGEMFTICNDIKTNGYDYKVLGKNSHTNTPIMHTSVNGGYAASQFPVYWAQYEGYEGYENYCNGFDPINEVEGSEAVFQQVGRLRALETIEETYQNYAYHLSGETAFLDGQSQFLAGEGIFHWNGDYFTTEMQLFRDAARDSGGEDYRIETFKSPVLSQLVEKLSFYRAEQPAEAGDFEYDYDSFYGMPKPYKNLKKSNPAKAAEYDAVLAAVIREIDEGKDWDQAAKTYNGYEITRADFNTIYEARKINASRTLPQQAAVIPATTPAKDVAVDFLRFFFTDEAIENYGVASKGLSFPVLHYENLNEADYEDATSTFEPEAKTKYDLMYGKNGNMVECKYIPAASNFLYGKFGLETIKGYRGNMNKDFTSKSANRTTAKAIFETEIRYWGSGEGSFWDAVVKQVNASGKA